ncbi:hypothetical protein PS645_01380 [Pseudomonas fluorescens]|uniref:Uncharacterized protein n=1 Tax=Pseudomonas fluorescens TaxID=294 RepID=A0A5E6RGN9_PSEFL|nr:hypothetical protein PS645_01380 [Pseudomonas fluorescens]
MSATIKPRGPQAKPTAEMLKNTADDDEDAAA